MFLVTSGVTNKNRKQSFLWTETTPYNAVQANNGTWHCCESYYYLSKDNDSASIDSAD